LYLENTCRSTKNKLYCSSWETTKKKKCIYKSTIEAQKIKYIVVARKPLPKKKKVYCSSYKKKPLLKRDL